MAFRKLKKQETVRAVMQEEELHYSIVFTYTGTTLEELKISVYDQDPEQQRNIGALGVMELKSDNFFLQLYNNSSNVSKVFKAYELIKAEVDKVVSGDE